MKSSHFAVAGGRKDLVVEPASVSEAIAKGREGGLCPCPFVPPEARKKIEALVVADLFPSDTARSADVVIAAAGLVETEAPSSMRPAGSKPSRPRRCRLPGFFPTGRSSAIWRNRWGRRFDYASVAEIRKEWRHRV